MMALSEKHIESKYSSVDENGRRYTTRDMRNPGVRPNLMYDYTASNGKTYKPHPNGSTCTEEKMRQYDGAGLLHHPRNDDGRLRMKLFLDERSGRPMQSLWDDIPPFLRRINCGAAAAEGVEHDIALVRRSGDDPF